MHPSPRLIWSIDPLPDFLGDHTLPGDSESERLREHAARWVQLVSSLWPWADRASFALRFVAEGGVVRVFLIGVARHAEDAPALCGEVEVLLKTHRLVRRVADARVSEGEFSAASLLATPVFADLAQHSSTSLWRPPPLNPAVRELVAAHPHLQLLDWESPPVVYPWRGPGGPFLLPLESLVSQSVRVALTIHLAPTQLHAHEWAWLAAMATSAQSIGDESLQALGRGAGARRVDPAANLAGRMYAAQLRRLSASPYLCLVQVAADGGRHDAARSVAAAVRALVHEPPFQPSDPESPDLPTGAAPYLSAHEQLIPYAAALYQSLDFFSAALVDPLGRLPILVDACAAATVFRLPVSVRGGVPGVRVRQLPPDFSPGPRLTAPPRQEPSIRLGTFDDGGAAFVPVRDLTRHALITGFTGTGKTVTVLQILTQLWADHRVPFLVLESAKQEYRGLLSLPAFQSPSAPLRIYTLGNETCVPMRINPFQLLPGVRVEAHLSRLQACFEAAVPPLGPSSSVIAEALHEAYRDHGWQLTDAGPADGRSRRTYPRLRDFVGVMERVIAARGYKGELLDNLRAALIGRFQPLLLGGKGKMFDAPMSDPEPAALFTTPAILEMNDLSVDDKALVVMFLLTLLREHREANRSDGQTLRHVTVVEEAHNVLENVASEGSGEGATKADTRHKAVEAFCAMLAEIRSLGEGLIIADQSPEKLARDAIRNTNLQISHQLRDARDRETVAGAMIMDEEQRDFLGKLDRGHAALFRTGLEKATFVKIDSFSSQKSDRGWGFRTDLPDEQVGAHMARVLGRVPSTLDLPFQGCALCTSRCAYRDAMFPRTRRDETKEAARAWWSRAGAKQREEHGLTLDDIWNQAAERALDAIAAEELAWHEDAAWCHFVHEWSHLTANRPNEAATRLDADHRALFLCAVARLMNPGPTPHRLAPGTPSTKEHA